MADLNTIFAPLLTQLQLAPPFGLGMASDKTLQFVLQVIHYVNQSPTFSS